MEIRHYSQRVLRAEKKTNNTTLDHIQYHDCYELYYLCQGECTYVLGGACYHLTAGSVILLPPGTHHRTVSTHTVRIVTYFTSEHIARFFSPALASRFACLSSPHAVRFSAEAEKEYSRLAHAVLAMTEDRTPNAEETEEKDEEIFYLLARMLCLIEGAAPLTETASERGEDIGKLLAYVDTHLAEISCIDDVAEALFFSRYHVCHLFQKKIGMSFITYLNMKRVTAAAALLRNGCSVTEAAEAVGFTSASYFSKVFKKEMLCSPTAYAKEAHRG